MTGPDPYQGVVLTVTDVTYPIRVVEADSPVLLAFTTYQDHMCQTLRPILSNIAREYGGRLTVAALDVATSPATAQAWGISQVPVMVILHRGVLQRVLLGIRPYARLAKEIDEVLEKLSKTP